MASLNKVLLMGNLTREPELRYTPGSNVAVCEFGIAMNRRFVQNGGQERDETCFVEIVVWGKQAESCSRFLQKGASVFIEGRLVYDQWVERDTQKKRSRLRVNAERVQFMSGRRDDSGAQGQVSSGDMPEEDPTRQGYSSPRPQQQYSRPAPQQQPQQRQQYARQQYNNPPQQAYHSPAAAPQDAQNPAPADAPAPVPDQPEQDPFENVDDIPF